jgi:hypothetical protein
LFVIGAAAHAEARRFEADAGGIQARRFTSRRYACRDTAFQLFRAFASARVIAGTARARAKHTPALVPYQRFCAGLATVNSEE